MQEMRQENAGELDEGWYFPVEVVVEILLRLPVISLLKFTTVCKEWNSLINSSEFVRRHCTGAANTSLLLRRNNRRMEDCFSIHSDPGDFVGTSLTIPSPFRTRDPRAAFHVFGSLHGLVCLCDYSSPLLDWAIFIWNPMARRYLGLTSPARTFRAKPVLGFGYDSSRDEYKLVRVLFFKQTEARQAQVYSLKENGWREVVDPNGVLQSCSTSLLWYPPQCFVEGAVHWVMREKNRPGREEDETAHYFILAFNVSHEYFSRMELPEDFRVTRGSPSLQETKISGLLTVGHLLSHSWEVWVKKEYTVDTSWTKFLSVSLVDVPRDSFRWIVGLWHDQVIIRAAYEEDAMPEPEDDIDRIDPWQGMQYVCSNESKEILFVDLRVEDKIVAYAADYQGSLVLREPGMGAATYGDVQMQLE